MPSTLVSKTLRELLKVFVILGLYADRDAGIRDHDVGAANRLLERAGGGDQRVLVGDVDAVREMRARQRRASVPAALRRRRATKPRRRAALREFVRQAAPMPLERP